MSNQAPENRNLGEQPIAAFLKQHGLSTQDLVAASPEPITHKMVTRACKGRWLTIKARNKMIQACRKATGINVGMGDLFNY
jgi:hypothetical protein